MFNKIAGAVLGTLLVLVTLRIVAESIFGPEEPHVEEPAQGEETVVADAGANNAALIALIAEQDPAAGEGAAGACVGCHTFEEGGAAGFGPNLYNIVNGPIAHMEGFGYSEALRTLHDEGEMWTYANLDAFLQNPQAFAPGTTMPFAGIADETNRAQVIAYLRSLSPEPAPLEVPAGAEAAAPDIGPLIAAADPAAGEGVAGACMGCHTVTEGGANGFGPNLWDIVNRPEGGHEGFTYSPALQAHNAAGDVWTYENLDAFLTNPQAYAPGTTMPFAGIANETDRHNLIAYLRTLSANPAPLPEAGAAPAPAEPAPAPAPEPAPAPAPEPAPAPAEPAVPAADLTPVTFTQAQVDEGREAYAANCAGCHGAELVGGFAPPLAGEAFTHWFSGPVSALYEKISTTMPMGNPGSLSPETYAAIVAFILSENGFTAGETELPTDMAALAGLGFTGAAAAPAEPAPAPAPEPAPAPAPAPEPAPAPAPEPAPAPAPEPAPAAEPAPAPAAEPAPAPAAEPAPAPAAEPAPGPAAEAPAAPAAEEVEIVLAGEDIANPALLARIEAGDVAAGETAATACAGCHTLAEGGANGFGPNLFGVVYRAVGGVEGFGYSPALTDLHDQGAVWTYTGLDAFLANPQAAVPGTTMPFGGIADETQRANIIAYLRSLATTPAPL